MANVNDFASQAAATSGGYIFVAEDRGASYGAHRFLARFERHLGGAPGDGSKMISAEGYDGSAQATATANALAALNAQRRHYYGGSPGRASGVGQSNSGRGGAHTIDSS